MTKMALKTGCAGLALAGFGLIMPAFAQSQVEVIRPGGAMPANVTAPMEPADRLAMNLRLLAQNPYDVNALTQAGESALAVGDANAALSFLARAEELSPANGRIKADLAAALVQLERPSEAFRLFGEAEALGVPAYIFAKDRGLAFDLRGDQKRAQSDYGMVLRRAADDEVTRRLALSLGISGEKELALRYLDPLIRKRDQGAWRARAFILAMSGDVRGAERIAEQVAPPHMLGSLAGMMRRLSSLTPAQKAAAVNFGSMPSQDTRFVQVQASETFRPIDQRAADVLQPAAPAVIAQPVSIADNGRNKRDRNTKLSRREREREQQVALARPDPVRAPLPSAPVFEPVARPAPAPVTRTETTNPTWTDTRVTRRVGERIGPVDPERLPAEARPAVAGAPAQTARPVFQPGVTSLPPPDAVAARAPISSSAPPSAPAVAPAVVASKPAFEVSTPPVAAPKPVFEVSAPPPAAPKSVQVAVAPPTTQVVTTPKPDFLLSSAATASTAPVASAPKPVFEVPAAPSPPKPIQVAAASPATVSMAPAAAASMPVAQPAAPQVSSAPSTAPVPASSANPLSEKQPAQPMPKPVQFALASPVVSPAIAAPTPSPVFSPADQPTSPVQAPALPPASVSVAPAPGFSEPLVAKPQVQAAAAPEPAAVARMADAVVLPSAASRPAGPSLGEAGIVEPPAPVIATAGPPAQVQAATLETTVITPPTVAPLPPAPKPEPVDAGLGAVLAELTLEQESRAGPVLSDAEFRRARAAAKRKAEEEARGEVGAADKAKQEAMAREEQRKAEEEEKRKLLAANPERIWVQVATGARRDGLGITMKKIRDDAPAALKGVGSAYMPFRATNRLLVGPFKSQVEARSMVGKLAKEGVSANIYTSEAGQEVIRLSSRS